MPTVYLLSYSQGEMQKNTPHARHAYLQARHAIPHNAKRLPEIDCSWWLIPPAGICAMYSGINESVQSHVLQDPHARDTINRTVDKALDVFRKGHRAVFVKTFCVSGTHRSVAMAELLGQHLRGFGVRTVVVHAHRLRMPLDAH